MRDGHGGVTIGSEISGGVRNVFAESCTMDSPNLDRALRFKNNAARGGVITSRRREIGPQRGARARHGVDWRVVHGIDRDGDDVAVRLSTAQTAIPEIAGGDGQAAGRQHAVELQGHLQERHAESAPRHDEEAFR